MTRWRRHLLVLLGFVVVGLVYGYRLLPDPLHSTVGAGNGDNAIFLFFLSNASHSLLHGDVSNILLTHSLNAPLGVNAMWNTSLLLPAVLLTPVTGLFGPVLSLNLIVVLGPVLSAWSAYLCSGRFLQTTGARVLTGLVFGFSPALMAANLGHYHLTLLLLLPPILLLAVDCVTRRRGPVLCGVLVGLGVTCQVLLGEEVLALTGVAVATLLVVLAVQHHRLVVQRLRPLLITGAVAGLTTLVTGGPFLAVQFFGPQRVRQAVSAPDRIVLDPASLVLPPPSTVALHQTGLGTFLHTTRLYDSESMGYLGVPLLVLLLVFVAARRRDVVVRTAAVMAVVLGSFALGYSLHLGGHRTGIPMPWRLTEGLPLVGNLLPVRWMLVVDLMVALLVGLAADAVARLHVTRRGQVAAWAALAVSVLALLPTFSPRGEATNTPVWFTTVGQHVQGGVLIVPLTRPTEPSAMLWSAEAGTRFPIPGGYFIGPHKAGMGGFGAYPIRPTAHAIDLMSLTGLPVPVSAGTRLRAREDLTYWGVRTVVLGPTPREDVYLAFLTRLIGRAPVRTGGVWVWNDVDPATL